MTIDGDVEEQLSRKVLPGIPGVEGRDDNDHVELVFEDSAPLGIVLIHHGDGKTLKVSEFLEDSQAMTVCLAAKEDPFKFVGAFIVGINGKDQGSCDKKEFYKELKDPSRPKAIKFQLRAANGHVSHGRAVVAKKDESLVELVFRESRPLGIKISKHRSGSLTVCEFPKKSQAEAVARERDIHPEEFMDSEIVAVNGRRYQDGEDLYEALKTPARPKAVLFSLYQNRPKRPSRRELLQKARFATESMRQLSSSVEEMKKMNAEVTEFQERRSKSVAIESPSGTPRAILRRIRKSVTSTDSEQETPPSRARPTFASESIRQLSSSIEEMEKMNAEVMGFQEKRNSITSESSPSTPRSILRGIRNNMASFNSTDESESPSSRSREIIQGFRNMRVGIRNRSTITKVDGVLPEPETYPRSSSFIDNGEDEVLLELVKQEAMEACRKAIKDHLDIFVEDKPNVSYEEWIEELHPENAKSRRNIVRGKSIDHRFYVEQSDHRELWNSKLDGGKREFVPVRDYNPVDKEGEVAKEKPKQFRRRPPTSKKQLSEESDHCDHSPVDKEDGIANGKAKEFPRPPLAEEHLSEGSDNRDCNPFAEEDEIANEKAKKVPQCLPSAKNVAKESDHCDHNPVDKIDRIANEKPTEIPQSPISAEKVSEEKKLIEESDQ